MIIRIVDYVSESGAIRAIRDEVFVREQGVSPELEHDNQDPAAVHVLAFSDGVPIGTGRITAEGRIGRMAVLAAHRGAGAGRLILDALVGIAERKRLGEVYCFAQCHAVQFYERLGFTAEGPVFLEAGIEHRRMFRQLGR